MKKSTSIVLAVLLVAALVAGGVFLSQKGDLQKKVDDLTAQVTTLTGELDTAKAAAATVAEEAAALKQQAEEIAAQKAQEAADKAAEEAAALQAEADAAAAAAAAAEEEAKNAAATAAVEAAATPTPVDTEATAEVTAEPTAEPTEEAKAEETAAPTEEAKAEATEEAKPEATEEAKEEVAAAAEGTAEIAMVTDIGTIDDKSFNQGTWEGIKEYAEANDKTFHYYQPTGQSTEIYLDYIEQAVNGGAKIVVTPGYLFEAPVYQAQDMYPDVSFILIDGNPNDGDWNQEGGAKYRTEKNTVGIVFAEEQAGFLAGYAAVKDGYKKLGFMGGLAVPAVIRFGYGFVQGAEYAAKEMEIDEITINYQYVNSFLPTPEVQTLAAGWYADGVEVIFACAGGAGNSVMAAAEAANAKVIGVDVDQSGESETVITSATKGLAAAVIKALGEYYDDKFPGGEAVVMDAKLDGVGLPMETSRFNTFTQEDYDAIFKKLVDGDVEIKKDSDVESVTEIEVEAVKVTELK